jgi:DNA-directed RNA polymerase subunit RPC12/RpoP
MPMKEKEKKEYPCTECGEDAEIGYSNFYKGKKRIIGKKERLCRSCASKRELPMKSGSII